MTNVGVTGVGQAWMVECQTCGWERLAIGRRDADRFAAQHTCPKSREKKQDTPRPRADWDGREGSTWIDKL